jgi:HAE1 family hydrophobic/amphiphilic exporter-1
MKPINERHHKHQSVSAIMNEVRPKLLSIPEAFVVPFEPPAVPGIGSMGGFQFFLQDKAGNTPLADLSKAQFQLLSSSHKEKTLTGLFATFNTDSPLMKIDIKRELATAMGIPVQGVVQTLQTLMGSSYVNDYTFENRSYRVYAQADSMYRDNPGVFDQFYVKGTNGQIAPIKSLLDIRRETGPQIISHFNLMRATEIDGAPALNASSGQAMDSMVRLSEQLPRQFGFEWAGLYLEQSESGGQMLLFLGLGVIFVFLVLAAQYESFVDPLIIIMSVPLAILGALLAIQIRGMDNNIFTQVGIILLIGLASKNAILIVEFANQLREQGHSILDAALTSARLRFRPIVMTSMAFIIGVIPLVFADGAGAQARQVIGTTVFGGMIVSTLLSLFIVPVQYIIIKSLVSKLTLRTKHWLSLIPSKISLKPQTTELSK